MGRIGFFEQNIRISHFGIVANEVVADSETLEGHRLTKVE